MISRRLNKSAGFTIIEAVVAAGVFAFVVASTLGVYMAVIQLDTKSRSERAVQQNAAFIMDYLAKEVRNGSIDYTGTNNATTLTIINQENQQLIFSYNSGTQILTLTKGGLGTTNLNSSSVKVDALAFDLNPTVDPFNLANDTHVQPHVTVTMQLSSTNQRVVNSATINLQSTIAVRDYPSRQ